MVCTFRHLSDKTKRKQISDFSFNLCTILIVYRSFLQFFSSSLHFFYFYGSQFAIQILLLFSLISLTAPSIRILPHNCYFYTFSLYCSYSCFLSSAHPVIQYIVVFYSIHSDLLCRLCLQKYNLIFHFFNLYRSRSLF